MLSLKKVLLYALLSIFLFSPPAFSQKSLPANKNANLKQNKETRSAVGVSKIKRSTEFVKEINGNVLVTEKNQYSLRGVNVVDRGKDRAEGPVNPAKRKRVAEMLFMNGELKQVVLH